jgi:hypothetical protein
MVPGWEKRFLSLDGSRAQFASSSAPLTAIFFGAAFRTRFRSLHRADFATGGFVAVGTKYLYELISGQASARTGV